MVRTGPRVLVAVARGDRLPRRHRQADLERAAAPRPVAVAATLPSCRFDERAQERQADAQPAVRSRDRLRPLHEHVEDPRQQRRFDAAAVIAHADDRVVAVAPQAEPHAAARAPNTASRC